MKKQAEVGFFKRTHKFAIQGLIFAYDDYTILGRHRIIIDF